MSNRYSKEQLHRIMSSVHSKDTKPELIVRKFLWKSGFRYRLNHSRLPGRPDIVLRKYRTCIFVNGCFWHGHSECDNFRIPKSNVEFWTEKIKRNRLRDRRVQETLATMGWHTITIWECELRNESQKKTLESLVFTLNHIFLKHHIVRRYVEQEDMNYSTVAEDMSVDVL